MINSLDEAIKHCEEVADGLDETAQEIAMQDENGVYQPQVSWYQDRASSQRQLAEWLKKLQAYEEAEEEINRKMKSGQWSETVVFGLNRAIRIIDKHLKEVNADE